MVSSATRSSSRDGRLAGAIDTVFCALSTSTTTSSPILRPKSFRDFLGIVTPAEEPICNNFCVIIKYYNIVIIYARGLPNRLSPEKHMSVFHPLEHLFFERYRQNSRFLKFFQRHPLTFNMIFHVCNVGRSKVCFKHYIYLMFLRAFLHELILPNANKPRSCNISINFFLELALQGSRNIFIKFHMPARKIEIMFPFWSAHENIPLTHNDCPGYKFNVFFFHSISVSKQHSVFHILRSNCISTCL